MYSEASAKLKSQTFCRAKKTKSGTLETRNHGTCKPETQSGVSIGTNLPRSLSHTHTNPKPWNLETRNPIQEPNPGSQCIFPGLGFRVSDFVCRAIRIDTASSKQATRHPKAACFNPKRELDETEMFMMRVGLHKRQVSDVLPRPNPEIRHPRSPEPWTPIPDPGYPGSQSRNMEIIFPGFGFPFLNCRLRGTEGRPKCS